MAAWAAVLLSGLCPARGQEAEEYQFKAAFLYHFTQLISWPESAFSKTNASLVIAVLGDNADARKVQDALAGKIANTHPLVCKPIEACSEATNGCHVLFVLDSEKAHLQASISCVAGAPVLTVGESQGFIEVGGMIHLFKDGQKVRFRINNEAADRAGLKISSKLLSLAATKAP